MSQRAWGVNARLSSWFLLRLPVIARGAARVQAPRRVRTPSTPNDRVMQTSVAWVSDPTWYRDRRAADLRRSRNVNGTTELESHWGCCPVSSWSGTDAGPMLASRGHARCCADKRAELPHLRPVGGLSYKHARALLARSNATGLLLIGDSLVEQIFQALLCKAWSEEFELQLHPPQEHPRTRDARTWKKMYRATVLAANDTDALHFRMARYSNAPSAAGLTRLLEASNESIVLLATWFERDPQPARITTARALLAAAARAQPHVRLLGVDGNVNHFPGGGYTASGKYPPALTATAVGGGPNASFTWRSDNASCDSDMDGSAWEKVVAFNAAIAGLATELGVGIVPVSGLMRGMGSVHVGFGIDTYGGTGGRDCLHWCMVLGVYDGLARITFQSLVRETKNHTAARAKEDSS